MYFNPNGFLIHYISPRLKYQERDDKYIVRETVNIEEGLFAVMEKVQSYQAILICDVKSNHRNRLVKYCYEHDIRVYYMPKISDIIIRVPA